MKQCKNQEEAFILLSVIISTIQDHSLISSTVITLKKPNLTTQQKKWHLFLSHHPILFSKCHLTLSEVNAVIYLFSVSTH